MDRRDFLSCAGALTLLATQQRQACAQGSAYAWRNLPLGGGGFVDGLAFHPKERGLLYARSDTGGAHRWNAAARAWQPLLDHLGRADADLRSVLSLALDPNDPQRVYLACGRGTAQWSRQGALLASADRGASWQLTELGVALAGQEAGRGSGERLQVDPRQGEVLLLGTSRDGLMRSLDRGRSFARLPGFPGQHVTLVLIDPASAGDGGACKTFYVGCHDKPGLYATRDGGRSFTREPGTPEQVPQRAAFGPDGSLVVSFAAGQGEHAPNPGNAQAGGLWQRDTAGRWREITPLKPGNGKAFGYGGLDIDARGRIVISTVEPWGDSEVFLSVDGGAHWTALSAHSQHDAAPWPWLANLLQGREAMGPSIADIKLDPHDPQHAVYGTAHGVWMTSNLSVPAEGGRVRWDFAAGNLELASAADLLSPSGGVLLFAAMNDVAGAAWDDAGRSPAAGLFTPYREACRSIDAAWAAPRIVARTADAPSGGYVSLDGGASWRPFGDSPAKDARGGRIAVSAKGTSFVWASDRQPAMVSRDRGRSWRACAGWPGRETPLVPVADRAMDGVFYAHDTAAGNLLVSADGGLTFSLSVTGLPKLQPWQSARLVSAPGMVRDLWIALPEGLLHLQGLEARAKTIRGVEEAWLVALGQAAPGASYFSVYLHGRVTVNGTSTDGLFRSDDAGGSWRRIDDEAHRYGALQALAADPLEHGTVYLAAQGRGVIVGKAAA